ncbi:MAG: MFS transporter, partial [Nitrososphaeraceae archaeon]|nr:MFS transporter [Nitrososphaeraceae archaeon]
MFSSKKNGTTTAPNAWINLAILSSVSVMVMYAETMLLPAIPDIIKDFNASYNISSWILSGYLITAAIVTPLVGKLSDIYGKKKILIIVLIIFAASIFSGGFTTDLLFLIGTRILQGVGLSVFTTSLSIIRTEFPQQRYGIAQTIISSSHAAGSAMGVGIGGFVIHYFGWHFTFISLIPIVIVFLLIVILFLRLKDDEKRGEEEEQQQKKQKEAKVKSRPILDIKGAITLAATVAAFLIAISYLNTDSNTHFNADSSSVNNDNSSSISNTITTSGIITADTIPIILIPVGAISLILFIKVERKAASPLIDLKLISNKIILSVNIMFIILETSKLMIYLTIPILIRAPSPVGFDGNAIEAGMVQNTFMLVFLAFAPIVGFIIDKFGNIKPLLIGSMASHIGYFGMLAYHLLELSKIANLPIISIGHTLISSAGWNILLRTTPVQFTGVSVGMTLVLDFIGMSIGPVIAGIYLQSNTAVFLKDGVAALFPSAEAYNLVFLTAALASIIFIVLAIFLKKVMPLNLTQ